MKSLYIHIPFCQRKCFYCSFVVSVGQEHRTAAYLEAIEREAQLYKGEKIQSVYIGGGTPTLITRKALEKLFTIIRKYFIVNPDAEWTIEANPEGLSNEKLKLLKEEGINRISLGIQSLNDKYLKYLGRNHDAAMAVAAYTRLRKAGFSNVNLDLMFAFPDQTVRELKNDVDAVLKLGSEHLSLYTLTVEEHSRFYARSIQLADDHAQAQQYLSVCDLLERRGFKQYEISNFAKTSKMSEHNLNYWQGGHYIGLGVGAHSYVGNKRSWNTSRLNRYLSSIQNGDMGKEGSEVLGPFDQMKEVILFGLRMNKGVSVEQTQKRFGCSLSDEQNEKIKSFVKDGFLIQEKDYLKTSSKGRLVLDELCAHLI